MATLRIEHLTFTYPRMDAPALYDMNDGRLADTGADGIFRVCLRLGEEVTLRPAR